MPKRTRVKKHTRRLKRYGPDRLVRVRQHGRKVKHSSRQNRENYEIIRDDGYVLATLANSTLKDAENSKAIFEKIGANAKIRRY